MAEKKYVCYHLNFQTPLHIGNERSDYSSGSAFLSNDALMAAVYFAWAKLGYASWIPSETTSLPFGVSSLFPYLKEETGEYTYFFPRPLVRVSSNQAELSTVERKKLKKVKWIDKQIFEALLNGNSFNSKPDFIIGDCLPSRETKSKKKVVHSQVVPRSKVSRTGEEDTVIFYQERFYFREDAGLFFFLDCNDPLWIERFTAAMNFLAEEGLGTDRNVGNGKFTVSGPAEISFTVPDKGSYQVNLGLYCPAGKSELIEMFKGEEVGFDWVKRGGWLSEPYGTWRKKNVFMIREGSCLFRGQDASSGSVIGTQVDLRPTEVEPAISHPIWRYGRTIFLPCKIEYS